MFQSCVNRSRRIGPGTLILALCLWLSACSSPEVRLPPDAQKTTPVKGMITVDGKPGWGVEITLHPKPGTTAPASAVTKGEGDKEGRFTFATYVAADGAPAGEYVLTFKQIDRTTIHILGGDDGPPDMFRGAFADPARSDHPVTIPDSDEIFDLGTIELTSPEK